MAMLFCYRKYLKTFYKKALQNSLYLKIIFKIKFKQIFNTKKKEIQDSISYLKYYQLIVIKYNVNYAYN